jgi:hypothetical protein
MQIVSLKLNHYNFFCPVTGERILDEAYCNENAKSLRGFWLDEFLADPTINSTKLESAWNKFVQKEGDEAFMNTDLLEKFLQAYPQPNWVVFKITNVSYGPQTVWKVIDMSTVI